MGYATSLFPLATYGFRIGAVQIPGTPDIESLIHEEHAPILIDPSLQGQSAPPMASQAIMSGPQQIAHPLLSRNDLKLAPEEEVGLVGPFRDQSLDRPGRLQELGEIFKSGAYSFEERIEAIDEATHLNTGAFAGQSVEALMELVLSPEAGLSFTFRESLSEEWRDHNHVKISQLWMHGLAAIFRLLKRGEIEDKKMILKQVILISLNHPRDVTLIHLQEDWPADDPHRVAPYLIDPDRTQRLLLGELLDQLTDGLDYDPSNYKDHELYMRTSHARQCLQANEHKIRKYLTQYDPVPSSRRNHRGKRFAAVLWQYRDLYLRLPARPDILFRTHPFAYKRIAAPKRLEAAKKDPET